MSDKPRLLDLFCGAGGAARGYQMAGFDVTGIDNRPQPRYAGNRFVLGDALEYVAVHSHEYDVIHASPPCQFGSRLINLERREVHENLIPQARALLKKPYVIENIPDNRQWLINPIMLCGSSFGLRVFRHRFFELGGFEILLTPPCQHDFIPVLLSGVTRRKSRGRVEDNVQDCRDASGINWMTRKELDQAIPPAYTHYIGLQLLRALGAA